MDGYKGRVALVTGCGKADGIGWATALALAKAGMAVVVADAQSRGVPDDHGTPDAPDGGLENLVYAIRQSGGTASWIQGDVTSEREAGLMVQHGLEQYGHVDVLVNNAGAPHGEDRVDIASVSLEAWEKVMAVNARGVFLMSRAVVPVMRSRQWGRIINLSSAVIRYGTRNRTAYSASKAAVAGFTQALAMDVASSGITVNAVCPGSILTGRAVSTTRLQGWTNVAEGLAERARVIPSGRHGQVDEVAALIAFLASESAGYMTGQALFIDGGGLPIPQYAGDWTG